MTDAAVLGRLAAAWENKWDRRWHYKVSNGAFRHGGGEAIVYGVSPDKVLAFDLGSFTHTRYQFSRPS